MAEGRRRLTAHRHYALLREYKATRVSPERMGRLGVHSVGIGRKEVEGKRTGTLALLFYVERKQPLERLSAEPVPESVSFLSRKDKREVTLPTDVIEMPRPAPEQDPETRIRPVPGGVSFGISGSTGTLGGWLWDTTDDTIVGVTNNHVLGNFTGTDTLQQGTADGGSLPDDKIGDVKRSIPRMAAPAVNLVDCAITDADAADLVDAQVLEVGPAVYAVDTPELDMLVEKFGQTTHHTFGQLTDVDLETTSTDGFSFDDQIRIVPADPSDAWSAAGDSGSLIFSQTPAAGQIKPAVGLHWGGGGVGCKIQNVFNALDLTTICSGLFAAFIEGLFRTEDEGAAGEETKRRLTLVAAGAVTPRERRTAAARRFHGGIAQDVQAGLEKSRRGRVLTGFVDEHRAEIADLLLKDGDVRRLAAATLRPIVAGATTSTEVLERALTAEDLQRLEALAKEVGRRAGKGVERRLGAVRRLTKNAEGRSAAEVLGIEL